jgi:hypothetical protein
MNFFVLRLGEVGNPHEADAIKDDPHVTSEPRTCSKCGKPITLRPWLPPRRVVLEVYGKGYPSFVYVSSNGIIVDEHARDVMIEHGISGLDPFEEVEIVRVKGRSVRGKPPPRYFVTGMLEQSARLDKVRSDVVPYPGEPCDQCLRPYPKSLRRLVLEEGSWTGLDVFRAWGCGYVIVTERFAKVVESEQLTNARLIPAAQFQVR